jgi:hypothetical protein
MRSRTRSKNRDGDGDEGEDEDNDEDKDEDRDENKDEDRVEDKNENRNKNKDKEQHNTMAWLGSGVNSLQCKGSHLSKHPSIGLANQRCPTHTRLWSAS